MDKNLKVFYMFNGLIVIAELIQSDNSGPQIHQALALAPGQQQGVMSLMEAFPFTSLDEVIPLERGSFVTMTEIGDPKIRESYMDALTQIRAKRSGIVLP